MIQHDTTNKKSSIRMCDASCQSELIVKCEVVAPLSSSYIPRKYCGTPKTLSSLN